VYEVRPVARPAVAVGVVQTVCHAQIPRFAATASRCGCQKANGARRRFTPPCPPAVTAVAAINPLAAEGGVTTDATCFTSLRGVSLAP